MNVKDTVELDIESNGMNGEGIAHIDGKVVFVPYTLKGERVRAVVRCIKKKYIEATVIKVLSPSPYRVAPKCPYYFKCDGCDMMHVRADYRREVLLGELANNLKKIAGLDRVPTELVAGEKAERNKLSLPFGLSDGKVVLGFYRHGTHDVYPVECMLAGTLTRAVASAVCEAANALGLSVYDERSGKGLLRHLVVREADGAAAAMLVINADGLGDRIERELAARMPAGASLFINPNTARTNVITGPSVRLLKGEPVIQTSVLGVKVRLSPLAFFQVNGAVAQKLYAEAIGQVSAPTFIDLYSGIGITSNLAAKKCGSVIAVECVKQAVENARETAELNGNSARIKTYLGDVSDVLTHISGRPGDSRTTAIKSGEVDVLVDPPRKGCGEAVMRAIAELVPEKLIYISCNHATMCRDIRIFLDTAPDYELTLCKAFDMFPYTHHVETLCVLSRRDI